LAILQSTAGNTVVVQLLDLQRCGPIACDCTPEERAAKGEPVD